MATNSSVNRRSQVLVGKLPDNFLVVYTDNHIDADAEAAQYLQAQERGACQLPAGRFGTLTLTIAQARLAKNYGLTRMDPYCRIRVGHVVYETTTAINGAKNPRWNKTFVCHLTPGVETIYVEILDERSFGDDSRVAWAHIRIPEPVLQNAQLVDEWHPLNGQQGDGKEGMVNIVWSYTKPEDIRMPSYAGYCTPQATPPGVMYPPMVSPAHMYMPYVMSPSPAAYGGAPVYAQPHQAPPAVTLETVAQLKEMFPAFDDDIITSVLVAERGSKQRAIDALLKMSPAAD